jgi:amidophosphoribosyltransferase
MISSVSKFNPAIKEFDVSVFTGNYVTGDIDEQYIQSLESKRTEGSKKRRTPIAEDVIGLHNNHMKVRYSK